MRKRPFVSGEHYHIFNRGVEKRTIFSCDADYVRFLRSMKEFNQEDPVFSIYRLDQERRKPIVEIRSLRKDKLVNIIAYCLNPNHFHFILKQSKEGGVSEFMKRIGIGYTGYFNYRYKRSGVLFQGKFKSVHIDSNPYLLYLSAYVNRNYFIHGYGDDFKWSYSSLLEYTGKRSKGICDTSIILDQFKEKNEYKEFIQENALYMKDKKETEKYLIES